MKFLTANEISKLWGISPRRVAQLAGMGRIDGAHNSGKKWLIPENAPKPADTRTKAAKSTEKGDKGDKYVFPLILATVHSQEQFNAFSPDEKALCRAECLYEACEFEECEKELKKLLSSDNRYIRLGALFIMTTLCFYQSDFENMMKYAVMFKTAYFEHTERCAELDYLYDCFNAEISDFRSITKILDSDKVFDYSDDFIPYLAAFSAAAECVKSLNEKCPPNTLSHEIICAKIEREGYFCCAILMHGYISVMYSFRRDEKNERRHLKRAIDIAVEHNAYFSLVQIMAFAPDSGTEILNDYPDDVVQRFRHCASVYVKARAALSEYCGNSPMLSQLKQEDYVLISYCLKEYSVEKMAELLSLSESSIKKRLSSLYKKLGVSSKKEMLTKYVALVCNPAT